MVGRGERLKSTPSPLKQKADLKHWDKLVEKYWRGLRERLVSIISPPVFANWCLSSQPSVISQRLVYRNPVFLDVMFQKNEPQSLRKTCLGYNTGRGWEISI